MKSNEKAQFMNNKELLERDFSVAIFQSFRRVFFLHGV